LVEVNTNPCLEESSKLLKTLIPRMLDDAFKLTLDKVFHKPSTVKVGTATVSGFFEKDKKGD